MEFLVAPTCVETRKSLLGISVLEFMNKGLSDDNLSNQKQKSFTILQRIAQNDKLAIEDCVDKYGILIWDLARKVVKTREDAEDAVQEIFIDIWKCAARFDASKSPECAFIILIAKRRLIDHLRKSYRQVQTLPFEDALKNRKTDAHKKLDKFVEVKCALDALNKLNFHEKQIIKLSIYGGASHSEIAQIVGLPIGTVKSRFRRGLHKIKNLVGVPVNN